MKAKQNEQGFTLVEIAVVLVIVGLLLGGIFKGQALIASTKTKSVISEVNAMTIAYQSYLDKYGAMPGDDKQAAAQVQAGLTNGSGNFDYSATEGDQYVYEHLLAAGMISGYQKSTAGRMLNVLGKETYFETDKAGLSGSVFCTEMPSEMAVEVDRRLDDADGSTGRFREETQQAYDPLSVNDVFVCTPV